MEIEKTNFHKRFFDFSHYFSIYTRWNTLCILHKGTHLLFFFLRDCVDWRTSKLCDDRFIHLCSFGEGIYVRVERVTDRGMRLGWWVREWDGERQSASVRLREWEGERRSASVRLTQWEWVGDRFLVWEWVGFCESESALVCVRVRGCECEWEWENKDGNFEKALLETESLRLISRGFHVDHPCWQNVEIES